MNTSFYSEGELKNIGFKKFGRNVLISRFSTIYSPELIEIGNNVRIDDFSVLSGSNSLGSNVHLAAGVYLFAGEAGITIGDFTGISSRVAIYAISDDYSGDYMSNPTIPDAYKNIIQSPLSIGRHCLIGSGTVILPGSDINEGTIVGALCLVYKTLPSWSIYIGNPIRKIRERSKKVLDLEKKYLIHY